MGVKPHALLLVGTVGSGKTTVMLEVGRLLGERGEPYALVDLDWLAWVEPPSASPLGVHDILAANLAAAAATFEQAGIRRLVLARHLTRAGELAAIETALAGAELTVVRLDAPAALLEARIRARDAGRELAEHLAELAGADRPDFPHQVVANDGRTADAVAADVLHAARW